MARNVRAWIALTPRSFLLRPLSRKLTLQFSTLNILFHRFSHNHFKSRARYTEGHERSLQVPLSHCLYRRFHVDKRSAKDVKFRKWTERHFISHLGRLSMLGKFISLLFLGATKHLYNWLCPLVGWLVGWSVSRLVTHSFDDPHRRTYWPTWPLYLLDQI